jgi:hypothetical protein
MSVRAVVENVRNDVILDNEAFFYSINAYTRSRLPLELTLTHPLYNK